MSTHADSLLRKLWLKIRSCVALPRVLRFPIKYVSLFPRHDQLVSYYNRLAGAFTLRPSTAFRQNVLEAFGSEEEGLWMVTSQDVRTGDEKNWKCEVLVQAARTYNRKKVPLVPNMVYLDGDMWHTVDWPEAYNFKGKKVAYVGTGPTFFQALPVCQPYVESLTIYMRSMTYCHPFHNIKYPSWVPWCFAWLPGFAALYACIVAYSFAFWTCFVFCLGTWLAKRKESFCNTYLDKQIRDPVLREKLRPRGRFGSKRALVSPLFFELVQKANVEVTAEKITEIDERGIKSITVNP
jgi:cation diffusion facilitator CzcD-associated flavoprotein CzcO